jgi:hypothetical protein
MEYSIMSLSHVLAAVGMGFVHRLFAVNRRRGSRNMLKLCILIMVTVLSSIGWWLGARFGIFTSFGLSFVGSLAGVYVGWRIHRDYLS